MPVGHCDASDYNNKDRHRYQHTLVIVVTGDGINFGPGTFVGSLTSLGSRSVIIGKVERRRDYTQPRIYKQT